MKTKKTALNALRRKPKSPSKGHGAPDCRSLCPSFSTFLRQWVRLSTLVMKRCWRLASFAKISNRRHVFKGLNKSEYEESFYARFIATQLKSQCMHDICRFRANIIRNSDGVWTTTQFVPHGCEPHTHLNRRYGRKAYSPEMLSDLLIPRLLEGLSLSAQDIRATLRLFLRCDASPSFIKNAREATFVRVTKITTKSCPGSLNTLIPYGVWVIRHN